MKTLYLFIAALFISFTVKAQVFTRSELPTVVHTPWELTFGPDNFLWMSDSGGRVSRINPSTGNLQVVYFAPDYFPGDSSETLALCFNPKIGSGTLGLALDPDFLDPNNSFIYFVYSYNSGTAQTPSTKFKVKKLTWDAGANTVTNAADIILNLSTGYDHLGGRLMAIKQNGTSHLFLSIGDHGVSETNSPGCYQPQSTNPNNLAQDPTTQNGKIHRFNMDGSIPGDNPIPGNSFYTRGHRNPQGLMYNYNLDRIYDVEHGDRSDDEINILHAGMNYGWKNVRGYHGDNNYPGEANYIANYTPDPNITGDSLIEAFYAWCATPQDTSSQFLDWCTVAPSDGIYYGNAGIPDWYNSLLVVTLKDGATTDNTVWRFKLQPNGELEPSTVNNPNPKAFFAEDDSLNGRLRDIAISPDGKKIYLINNAGPTKDKITIYTYDSLASGLNEESLQKKIDLFPNPVEDVLYLSHSPQLNIKKINIHNSIGQIVQSEIGNPLTVNTERLAKGIYIAEFDTDKGKVFRKFIKK